MAVEVPAVTRRVKRAACHAHRASRARMRTSSPRIARIVTVSVPPAHDRHARATAALARSIDRARGVALAMAVKEAVGYTARHVRHKNARHSRARARERMGASRLFAPALEPPQHEI